MIAFNSLSAQVTQEWVAKFKDSTTGFARPTSISTDNSGNSYVTGSCYTVDRSRIIALKYSSQGILQWYRIYQSSGSEDIALKSTLDKDNNLYVVGYSHYEPNNYVVILKYNSGGDSIWVRRYTEQSLLPRDIVIDKYSNIYITSRTEFIGVNYFTMKYDSSGNLKWNSMYNFGDIPESIALDSMENVLITGKGVGTGFNYNYITVKYDNNGNLKWARNYSSSGDAEGKSIACSINGDIYVTGFVTDFLGNSDYATLKYDTSGNLLWTENFDRESSKDPRKLLVDSLSNCFIIGSSAILKYDSSGKLLWSDTSSLFFNRMYPTLDKSGYLYTTSLYSMNTLFFIKTTKFGIFGNKVWERVYGDGVENDYNEPFGISLDKNNNVFIAGIKYLNGIQNTDTVLTIKYSQLSNINNTNQITNKEYELLQNYPNPFNPKTVISYQLAVSNNVSIKVYDVLGNEIKTLVNEKQNSGSYKIGFDGSNLPSGIYFYKFISGSFSDTKRMILLK